MFNSNLKLNNRNDLLDKVYKILIENEIRFVCIGNPFYINHEEGDIDIELLKEPLLYKSTTPSMIRKLIEKNEQMKEEQKAKAEAEAQDEAEAEAKARLEAEAENDDLDQEDGETDGETDAETVSCCS